MNNATAKNKKLIPILISVAALLVVAAIVLWLLWPVLFPAASLNVKDVCLYVKDKQLYATDFENTVVVSNVMYDKEGTLSYYKDHIVVSKDGSRLFYPENGDENSYTLYMKRMDDLRGDAVKIDTQVTSFKVNDNGSTVTYVKGNSIYQSDLKTAKKLVDGVESIKDEPQYFVSSDGKHVFYFSKGLNYISGNTKVNFSHSIDKVVYSSADLSRVIYSDNGNLVEVTDYNNARLLGENAAGDFADFSDEHCYFFTEKALEVSDYVVDPYVDTDPAAKQDVRKALQQAQASGDRLVSRTVYYYEYGSGADPVIIGQPQVCFNAESYKTAGIYWEDGDKNVVMFDYSGYTLTPTHIDQIDDVDAFIKSLLDGITAHKKVYFVKNGERIKLDDIAAQCRYYCISDDENFVYAKGAFGDIVNNLYKFDVSSGESASAQLHDEDVANYILVGDEIVYFKENPERDYQLYIGNQFILSKTHNYAQLLNDGKTWLLQAYDTENRSNVGLIKYADETVWEIGKIESKPYVPTITWYVSADDNILWSSDYDSDTNTSTIKYYTKEKIKTVADGVEGVIYFDGKLTA